MAPVASAVLPVARTALDAGQVETARRLYRRLLDVQPESFQARMGLGEVAHQQRDATAAARWFLAALAHAGTVPQRHEALLHHGRAALDAGQLEQAQGSFARLTDPQEAAAIEYVAYGLNGVGLTRLLSGDLRGAVTLMERAVEHLPGDQKLRGNLTLALQMLAEQVANTSSAGEELSAREETRRRTTPEPLAPGGDVQAAAARIEQAVARFEQAAERLAGAAGRDTGGARRAAPPPRTAPQDVPARPPSVAGQAAATRAEPADAPGGGQRRPDTGRRAAASAPERSAPPTPAVQQAPANALPPPSTVSGFLVVAEEGAFVQMGAYASPAKANALAARLRAVTEQPVRVAERDGLHRVRIGPLKTGDARRALVGALRDAGYGDVRMPPEQTRQPLAAAEAPPDEVDASAVRGFAADTGAGRVLQMGAYENQAVAATLARQLRTVVDETVRLVTAESGGATVHRVQIGPIVSDSAWARAVRALRSAGYRVDERGLAAPAWQAFVVARQDGTFLQFGAFEVAAAADERARVLRAATDVPVRVTAGVLPSDAPAHRVHVGPLESDADIEALVAALAAAGQRVVLPAGTTIAGAPGDTDAVAPAVPEPAEARATSEPEAPPEPEPSPAPVPPPAAPPPTPRAEDAAPAPAEAASARTEAAGAQSVPDEAASAAPATPAPLPPAPASAPRRARAYVITEDEGVFIQIGDYDARTEAEALAVRIRGLTVKPVQVMTPARDARSTSATAPFYRVRVGPVETDADYEALLAAVAALGFDVQ